MSMSVLQKEKHYSMYVTASGRMTGRGDECSMKMNTSSENNCHRK